jgi:uncharacterized protein (DUF2252 family)
MAKSKERAPNFPRHALVEDREASGQALRDKVSRKSHAEWTPPADRKDPVKILEESNHGRIPELIPIRYGRMVRSPFTFFRGSAALMAADLDKTPSTGLYVQSCGDCHLLNFGGFATPERNLIVDINDFDETLPAPWEWDLKRLATSFVLACRSNSFKPAIAYEAAETLGRAYRQAMREFADMSVLDVWYSKMTSDAYLAGTRDKDYLKAMQAQVDRLRKKNAIDYYVPKLTHKGRMRFIDSPPLVFHSEEQHGKDFWRIANETFENYKASLSEDRRMLIDRYDLMDVAMKIVGIGSVGTYCGVLLLSAAENDPLILQVKEARASVLEPYAGKSRHHNHGQRVVVGQRIMQAHSDIFLGWMIGAGPNRRHFYVRQLKDMKIPLMPELWTSGRAVEVAESLGWVLARAHARSGDAATIGGYLGSKDVFDRALADFAVSYADQTERDHDDFCKAIRAGRLNAYIER